MHSFGTFSCQSPGIWDYGSATYCWILDLLVPFFCYDIVCDLSWDVGFSGIDGLVLQGACQSLYNQVSVNSEFVVVYGNNASASRAKWDIMDDLCIHVERAK